MPRGVYERKPRARPPLQQRIRVLRAGDPIPEGAPRRYPDRDGYVRLRWRVGPGEQVEIREHRLVAPGADSDVVHHINHDPTDNRPENLVRLSKDEHTALHGGKRERFSRHRAAQLYAAGLSTTELGRLFGVHHVTIARGLAKFGVTLRGPGEAHRVPVDEALVLALHDSGWKAGTIGRELGVTRMVIARVLRENGRKPHGSGRPARR